MKRLPKVLKQWAEKNGYKESLDRFAYDESSAVKAIASLIESDLPCDVVTRSIEEIRSSIHFQDVPPEEIDLMEILDDLVEFVRLFEAGEIDVELAERRRGNIKNIIKAWNKWTGDSFRKCVGKLRDKPGIRSPEKLCGWLMHQAKKMGVIKKKHRDEAYIIQKLQEVLTGKVLRGVALKGAGSPAIKGIPRTWRVVGKRGERELIEFPVAVVDVVDPITGRVWLSSSDAREIVKNFDKAKAMGVSVPVKLDHVSDGPLIGEVETVRFDGRILWVTALAVPRDKLPSGVVYLSDALDGPYPEKSIEFDDLSERPPFTFRKVASFSEVSIIKALHPAKEAEMEKLEELQQRLQKLEESLKERDELLKEREEQAKKLEEKLKAFEDERRKLEEQLERERIVRLAEKEGLFEVVPDAKLRDALPDILLATRAIKVKLGEEEVSLKDALINLLRAVNKRPPEGVIKFEEPKDDVIKRAERIAKLATGLNQNTQQNTQGVNNG